MVMRSFLGVCLIGLAITSCSVANYMHSGEYVLTSIETPTGVYDVDSSFFSDDFLAITTSIEDNHLSLEIVNVSNSSFKVDWDGGAWIDMEGKAHRIIHTGTKFIDKEKAQVPSVVPRGASISEIVAPSDNVDYDLKLKMWDYKPLFDTKKYKSKEEAEEALNGLRPTKLLLPIESNNIIREYTFVFNGKNLAIDQIRTTPTSTKYLLTLLGFGSGVLAALIITGAI